jgi:(E)-4-hydroxy-3-methyl-but-2-enyl pyrophosphate reductase (IPP and DMAPP forming)
MEIKKARELGLCFGVRRAIKLLKEAVSKYGEIETLGPVAHNRQLVEELIKAGIKPINHIDQVQGRILAITTHGTSPAMLSEIEARHIHTIDITCPIVRKAQNAARDLADAGFDVIIFGEAEHSEVKGLLGWAGDKGIAALNVKQINMSRKLPYRLGVISQTTQTQSAFIEFTTQLMVTFGFKAKEMRIVNTLCQATQKHQEAALKLARKSQLMLVIGGYDSANTKRLAEACSSIVETHLIEEAGEVNHSWLTDKHHIGITAGASTPDDAIEKLVVRLKSL